MDKKISIVVGVVVACLVTFIAVTLTSVDLNRNGNHTINIIPIEKIIESPERYNNTTIAVEGILGDKIGYTWQGGETYGIYAFNTTEEYQKYKEESGKLLNRLIGNTSEVKGITIHTGLEFGPSGEIDPQEWEQLNLTKNMLGKKVRATGTLNTEYMSWMNEKVPILIVKVNDIKAI